jgi:uncharacterized protein YggE
MNRVAFGLILVAAAAMAEDKSAAVQANTVYVSAQGTFEAAPDVAVLQFSLSAQEKSARAAYDRATKAVDQVRDMLRSAGVEPSVAEFGSFQLRPLYDYHGSKRKITAYQVNSSVALKLKDFSKAGPILDQISNVDVAENISLNYNVENTENAKRRAVEAAMTKARGEAEAVARAGGRALGDVVYASIDTQEHVRIAPAQVNALQTVEVDSGIFTQHKAAPAPAPMEAFTPQAVAVTATVYALFAFK